MSRLLLSTALAVFVSLAPARADVVRLKSGGELRGTILNRAEARDGSEPVRLRLLSGATTSIPQDSVDLVAFRPQKVEEYETRAANLPATAEAHFELAEWAKSQRLDDQRREQLEAVVAIDPGHAEAHRGLGHVFVDGEWIDEEEHMRSQGLVKYKRRWITPQEKAIYEQSEAEIAAERAWYKKARLWTKWLEDGPPERTRATIAEIAAVDELSAVPALRKNMADHAVPEIRAIYTDTLVRLSMQKGGPAKTVGPLLDQAMRDVEKVIRDRAAAAIAANPHELATPILVKALRHERNEIVLRAAALLGEVGDKEVLPALVEALVTEHVYKVVVEDRSGEIAVNTNGAFGTPQGIDPQTLAMLRQGNFPNGAIIAPAQRKNPRRKIVKIKQTHKNIEVLEALKKLTGEDFGFVERQWKLWLASQANSLVN